MNNITHCDNCVHCIDLPKNSLYGNYCTHFNEPTYGTNGCTFGKPNYEYDYITGCYECEYCSKYIIPDAKYNPYYRCTKYKFDIKDFLNDGCSNGKAMR